MGMVLLCSLLWVGVGSAGTWLLYCRAPASPQEETRGIAQGLERLGLTPEQQQELEEIVRRYREHVLSLHQDVEEAQARFWEQVRSAEVHADLQIEALLSVEQRRQYQEMILGGP